MVQAINEAGQKEQGDVTPQLQYLAVRRRLLQLVEGHMQSAFCAPLEDALRTEVAQVLALWDKLVDEINALHCKVGSS